MQLRLLDKIRLPLVNRLYKQHYSAGKAKADETIWVAKAEDEIIAVVRFKQIEQQQLLTGMLVVPEHRGKGVAIKMLEQLSSQLHSTPCYCFALEHLEGLYQQGGFETIDVEQLPANFKSRYLKYHSSKKPLLPMRFKAPV